MSWFSQGTSCVQHHAFDPQELQGRCGCLVFSHIWRKPQAEISLFLIQTFSILEDIGSQLVAQTNALPFLALQIPHVDRFKCWANVALRLEDGYKNISKYIKVISAILSKKTSPQPSHYPIPKPFPPFSFDSTWPGHSKIPWGCAALPSTVSMKLRNCGPHWQRVEPRASPKRHSSVTRVGGSPEVASVRHKEYDYICYNVNSSYYLCPDVIACKFI